MTSGARRRSGAVAASASSLSPSSSAAASAPPEVRKLAVPCKFYREGRCAEGRRCRFRHVKPSSPSSSSSSAASTAPDAPACRFFPLGTCRFGDRCALAHVRPQAPPAAEARREQAKKAGFVVITPDGRRINLSPRSPPPAPADAGEKRPSSAPGGGTGTGAAQAGESGCAAETRWRAVLASVPHGPPPSQPPQTNFADARRGEEPSGTSEPPAAAFAGLSITGPAVGYPASSPPPREDPSSFFAAQVPTGYRRRAFCPLLSADAGGGDAGGPPAPVCSPPAASFFSYSTVASKGIAETSPGECAAAAAASQGSRAVRTEPPTPPQEEEEENRANERRQGGRAGENLECSICLESVLEKRQRFGLLDCAHCFCLPCIRDWRSGGSGAQVKSCPQCRVLTHFVVPSSSWITDKEEKERLREEYKRNTSNIACKHYNYGQGSCPFGTSCHYAHINRDGTRQEVTLRKYVDENEDMHIMSAVRLSDFL